MQGYTYTKGEHYPIGDAGVQRCGADRCGALSEWITRLN